MTLDVIIVWFSVFISHLDVIILLLRVSFSTILDVIVLLNRVILSQVRSIFYFNKGIFSIIQG